MIRLFVFLLSAGLALPQVAENANTNYKTAEGRERLSKSLVAHNRDETQKPEELVAALKLAPGMTVADIGTGAGYMLPFLAKAVGPAGKVVAEDIFPDFLEKAKQRAKELKLNNVDFILGNEKDPKLPAGAVDLALILDAYHHFNYPPQMLAGLKAGLKRDGRLAIVDFYKAGPGKGDHVRLEEGDVIKEVTANGFELISSGPFVEKRQYIAIFRKK
jgi:ubiquinone/menaquinone biosynthesis C-methylase UbiE